MIKHIVMFKLKPEADGKTAAENAAEGKKLAEKLLTPIPSLKKLRAVINCPGADETNCELALVCDFDDLDGLSAYQASEPHIRFGSFIKPVRESRACIDYEY